MSLNVINHSPSINQTGIFRNDNISIGFNKAINKGSVDWSVLSVNDSDSYSNVVGELGVLWNSGGYVTGVYFTPELNLDANTNYSVFVYGRPNSVVALDGQELDSTYSWSFTTGTGLLSTTGSGGLPSGVDSTGIAYTDLSGLMPSDESAVTTFSVYTTDPQNQEPNVNTQTDKAILTFTGQILTSLSDISGFVTIEESPVLY